jgi:hypothetical protein
MTTRISADNIQPATLASIGSGPKISQIIICNSSYTELDDTAISLGGGYIKIIGSGFKAGATVTVNRTAAMSVTFISSTELRAQVSAEAANTYIVYVVNTDGSVALRVNGLTYSSEPTWVTGSVLTGDSGTAVSIQLSATGASTYALQAGSTLPANLTLSSEGLIAGTVTVGDETLYNFVVVATDAELQDSPRSFSITITAGDPQIKYVTTLLSANINTVPFTTDASTNNSAVSVVGDTRPNNFGPYTPGYYSNYFDGTGDYLSVPNNSSLALPGDFTIEAWVYFTTSGVACGFVSTYLPNTTYGVVLGMTSANVLIFRLGVDAGGFQAIDSVAIVPGVWYHVAGVRSGNTMTLYKNGVSVGSVGSVNITSDTTTAVLGRYYTNTDNFYLTGYISNARIVKGTTVYTANFTPSTTPLTAITGTSLLTCQSSRFIDNSTNNFAITRAGDTSVSGFDPFVPSTEFAGRGSTYFDGTGDYLTVSAGTSANVGSIWTVECWLYPNNVSGTGAIVNINNNAANPGVNIYRNGATITIDNGASAGTGPSGGTLVANTWQHIAIVADGTNTRIYLDGLQVGATFAGTVTSGTPTHFWIGSSVSGLTTWAGYISNLRILKGTAAYTAAFTPPSAPLTAVSGTSLLTCQTNQPVNNNVFLDSSTNNFLVTRNGNATQGAFSPYGGGWSNYFNGNGDYLTLSNNAAFDFGSGDFTFECWFFLTGNTGLSSSVRTGTLFSVFPNSGTLGTDYSCSVAGDANTTGTGLSFAARNSGTQQNTNYTGTITQNTWHHVAVTKTGTTVSIYYDGIRVQQNTSFTNVVNSGGHPIKVGALFFTSNNNYFPGYISNLRIVKGTAVYTANFTPPIAPLTPITGTSLLTCADHRLVDDSPNNFTITRNGNVSVQKFNPYGIQTSPVPLSHGTYFGTKTNSLSIPATTALTTFTGDFTFECWVYPTDATLSTTWGIWDSRQASATAQPMIFSLTALATPVSGSWRLSYYNGTAKYGTGVVLLNQWSHVAFVRSGTTMTFYVNGVAGGTAVVSGTQAGNATTNPVYIGTKDGALANYGTVGYISDFRIVNGTAVYTTNFTPSTTPLTAIANTTLLTCQNSTFVDNSTNRFVITVVGSSQPSAINPFGFTAGAKTSYTPAVYGGSAYFDGTGDYLTVPSNAAFTFNTGAFTMEAWIYPTVNGPTTGNWIYTNFSTTTGNSEAGLIILNAGTIRLTTWNTAIATSTLTAPLNTWTHVAASFDGTTYKIFVNGTLSGTSTTVQTLSGTGGPVIGHSGQAGISLFTGYISNLRIVKGTALYTSNFVPPTAPLLPVTNTTLLLNATGAAVYDASTLNNLETVGDAKVSTSVVKYGNTSMSFDGSGDWLVIPDNPNINLGSGDFTLEFWVYFNVVNAEMTLINKGWTSSVSYASYLIYMTNTGSVRFLSSSSGGAWDIANEKVITQATAQTWTHIALTRSGSTFRTFVNGSINDSFTFSSTLSLLNSSAQKLLIGGREAGSNTMNGNISDLRINKGVARYTADFTPPTTPLSVK